MVTKVTANAASASQQANTQTSQANTQNSTQSTSATAAQNFAAAMQQAKAQAAANSAQAGSPNGYVQTLQNDVKVLNTPVYSIHDPLYSQQVQARQSIYNTLMDASKNGQIDSVLKALSSSDLQTINSQLERGLSLQGDPAFTQTQRDDLFKAMVNGGASGQSLARFMGTFAIDGSTDVLSMLNASGMKSGVTNQILSNSNTDLLNTELLDTTSTQERSALYANLSKWGVSASNLQRMADSLTDLTDVMNFKAATGVTPSRGYEAPLSWNAYSDSNPNGDPINIIISGKSNVPIGQILNALGNSQAGGWGQGPISTEYFDPGLGSKGQDYGLRQGGWETELNGPILFGATQDPSTLTPIDHLRDWQQPGTGASFILASQEYFTVKQTPDFAGGIIPHPWHSIWPGGYDGGRDQLLQELQTVANVNHWHMTEQWTNDPEGPGVGSDNVSYDGRVAVVTMTA